MAEAVLDEIRRLEEELLLPEVRSDANRLSELLHPEFVEFGSSGTVWTRDEILLRLPAETGFSASISEVEIRLLAPDVALVTFEARISNGTGGDSVSLRTSVWLRESGAWRVRFHQGTPIRAHVE